MSDGYPIARARALTRPLERAWGFIAVARSTTSKVDFIDALNEAMDAGARCWGSDADLVRETVAKIQRERGPAMVPEQLALTGDAS